MIIKLLIYRHTHEGKYNGISSGLPLKNKMIIAYSNGSISYYQISDDNNFVPKSSVQINSEKKSENDYVTSMTYSGNETEIFMATYRGNIYKYNYTTDSLQKIFNSKKTSIFYITNINYDKQNNRLIFTDYKNILHFYSIDSLSIYPTKKIKASAIQIINNFLLVSSTDGKLLSFNLNNIEDTPKVISEDIYFNKIVYLKNSNLIACTNNNKIAIFSAEKINHELDDLIYLPIQHDGTIKDLEYNSETNQLISSDFSGLIMIWDFPKINKQTDLNNQIKMFRPIILNTKLNILNLFTRINNNYLYFTDINNFNCTLLNIDMLYNKVNENIYKKNISKRNWEFYKKGSIIDPILKK